MAQKTLVEIAAETKAKREARSRSEATPAPTLAPVVPQKPKSAESSRDIVAEGRAAYKAAGGRHEYSDASYNLARPKPTPKSPIKSKLTMTEAEQTKASLEWNKKQRREAMK